jgi:hypothetical protein
MNDTRDDLDDLRRILDASVKLSDVIASVIEKRLIAEESELDGLKRRVDSMQRRADGGDPRTDFRPGQSGHTARACDACSSRVVPIGFAPNYSSDYRTINAELTSERSAPLAGRHTATDILGFAIGEFCIRWSHSTRSDESSLLARVLGVIATRSKEQMVRATAQTIVAMVENP